MAVQKLYVCVWCLLLTESEYSSGESTQSRRSSRPSSSAQEPHPRHLSQGLPDHPSLSLSLFLLQDTF